MTGYNIGIEREASRGATRQGKIRPRTAGQSSHDRAALVSRANASFRRDRLGRVVGQVLRDTNPGLQPFGFQGGLYDPDTGLVEFGCRWYDAETGRWISKDPIGLEGGFNLYEFCGGEAINRIDPKGTFVIAIGGGGAAGAGSAVAADSGLVFGFSFKNGFQFGSYQTGGVGFHVGADASFGTVITIAPFADDITDISGLSESVGGSIGWGPSGTVEVTIPIGASPQGSSLSLSFGAGIGAEKHAVTTETFVQPLFQWDLSRRDCIEK